MIALGLSLILASTVEVAVGGAHTCVLEDGAARCFGRGAEGQLGPKAPAFARAPGVPLPVEGVEALALGARHSCALARGAVRCFGLAAPEGLRAVKQIAAGEAHACALTGGEVRCWGDNRYGQAPARVDGVEGAVEIALGDHHGCARDAAGAVRCWGAGYAGQRGDGARAPAAKAVLVEGLTATAVAAGGAHTCASTAEGARCFGAGGQGQLGGEAPVDQDRPVATKLEGALALGRGISCGLDAGRLRCIGALPLEAEGVRAAAAAFDHLCVVDAGGVRCAGDNSGGQLGVDLGGAPRTSPVVLDAGPAQRVRATRGLSCVEKLGGARCRGEGPPLEGPALPEGALLSGTSAICALAPTPRCLPAGSALERGLGRGEVKRALEVALGGGEVCTRAPDGVARCGGAVLAQNTVRVAAGRAHACALGGDGKLRCRGENLLGQLGLGDRRARTSAALVEAPVTFASVSAGWDTTCAILRGGRVACFGAGFGPTPAQVVGLSEVQKIVVGRRHACALSRGGKVRCFGANDRGQLGRGDLQARPLPGPVEGLADVVDLDAGEDHTCALTRAGQALCWGDNARGEVEAATLSSMSLVSITPPKG